jgi:hypothetical protein
VLMESNYVAAAIYRSSTTQPESIRTMRFSAKLRIRIGFGVLGTVLWPMTTSTTEQSCAK